jgi:hypothetical protein
MASASPRATAVAAIAVVLERMRMRAVSGDTPLRQVRAWNVST